MTLLKITDHPDLVKDTRSGAILANNPTAYDAYIRQREYEEAEERKMTKLENSVIILTKELNDIKSMIMMLIDESNKK